MLSKYIQPINAGLLDSCHAQTQFHSLAASISSTVDPGDWQWWNFGRGVGCLGRGDGWKGGSPGKAKRTTTHIPSLHCPMHFTCLQQLDCLSRQQHRRHSSNGDAACTHLGFVEGQLVLWEGGLLNELIKEPQHLPQVFCQTLKACTTHISLGQP